jgi:hypothetical protein
MTTEYLGDGLYAKFENCQIVLMANDPHAPTDTVYLEWPDVYEALLAFVGRTLDELSDDVPDDEVA